jgi:hypothetical protein
MPSGHNCPALPGRGLLWQGEAGLSMAWGPLLEGYGRTAEARRPRPRPPSKRDYHFYHFSPRLPLQNAMKCDDLIRIAKGPNRGTIPSKLLVPKGFLGFLVRVEYLSTEPKVTGSSPVGCISSPFQRGCFHALAHRKAIHFKVLRQLLSTGWTTLRGGRGALQLHPQVS